jgi:pimeloyl-ACP methyl ester carboxylesterase
VQISVNGLSLEVEDHGPAAGEPLLLIMGLGMQLVAWPDGFVRGLVERGFRVIRFDNRDIGLSQHFDHLGAPHLALAGMRYALHLTVPAPYGLSDLADDAAALIAALGLASAHVCVASMGGMVAQHLAARQPQRVRSLTLMMSTSGSRRLPQPGWRIRQALLTRPEHPTQVDSVVAHAMRIYRLIGSPGYPADPIELRAQLERAIRRSYRPASVARQVAAIMADGDRSVLLPRIAAPTQVIHGRADPLVPVAAGHDLARRIPGARLDEIDGMGHDLPAPLWPRFIECIEAAARRS